MIETRYGDILDFEGKYICQGVNTLGKMGAGLALQIRNKYPKVYEVYKKKNLKLGDCFGVDCGEHIVLNIATQKELGKYKKPFNYTAFQVGLNTLNNNIVGRVAFPTIGCGLGGAYWPEVEKIIVSTCTNIIPVLYLLNDEIPQLK